MRGRTLLAGPRSRRRLLAGTPAAASPATAARNLYRVQLQAGFWYAASASHTFVVSGT